MLVWSLRTNTCAWTTSLDAEEEEGGAAFRTRVIVATSDMEERNAEYQSQSGVLWQNSEGTSRADGGQRRLQSRALQEQN